MKTRSEIVWLEYHLEINRFVLSKIKDKDEVNDIMQDIFIKMYSNLNKLKDEEKIRSWLYQIARNTIHDYFRKQKLSSNSEEHVLSSDSENRNINEKFSACVQPHINKLPSIYKEALIKVELQNCSQLQLARELNISYSALKSRVQRGRELLKSYFKACCNISTDKYGNILEAEEKHKCSMC